MSIPTQPNPQHPQWCAGEPVCSAYDVETDVTLRQHRGPVFGFRALSLDLELTLVQAQRSYPSDVFVIAVVKGWRPQEPGQVGVTLSLTDAERLLDVAAGLIGQVAAANFTADASRGGGVAC